MKYFILIISMVLIQNSYAGTACRDYFQDSTKTTFLSPLAQDNPIEFTPKLSEIIDQSSLVLEDVRKLRKYLGFMQKITGDEGRKSLHDLRMLKKQFFYLLRNMQDTTIAIEQYRDKFLDVELGWFRLQDTYKAVERGEKPKLTDAQILELKKRFAIAYPDYVYIRIILEGIINDKLLPADKREIGIESDGSTENQISDEAYATLRKNAVYVYKSLGTPSFVNQYSAMYIKRPSLPDIQNFFREHPDLLVLKLKNDLLLQSIYAIKMVPVTFTQVETIQTWILKIIPVRYRKAISGFIGMNYNYFVTKKYLPDIETILNTPNDFPNQRLEVLRLKSAKADTAEFLMTFARITLYSPQWIKLKEDSKNLISEPLYNRFYEQMLEAEKKAIGMDNWINPFYKPSFVDHIKAWIGPTLAVLAYEYYDNFAPALMQNLKSALTAVGL